MIVKLEEFLEKNLTDEVFIIETDTVYGIGCLYTSSIGAERILDIKERSGEKHYSLLISNYDQLSTLAKNYDEYLDLIKKYWPGQVTFIFEKTNKVGSYISQNDTVGLRMPNSPVTLKALEKFGPMIMTSVNKSGEPAITKYIECLKYENKVDYIVEGGDLTNVPSTVVDLKNKKILREGIVKINF